MSTHPFQKVIRSIDGQGQYFSLPDLQDPRVEKMPYCIRILLESAVRNCDEFEIKAADVEKILSWEQEQGKVEVPFKPARVILQDFTGVPAVVDFAAMRDAMARLGGDPKKINPLVPADLVIDHSVQVDFARTPDALKKNQDMEFHRNNERFSFLKWGAQAFNNMLIVPPGSGIVHQVNLEYLARVVFHNQDKNYLYPDSLVGTDSHTTMIDALGIAGWGVGGIEAEAVMLGQPISMVLPEVVGFKMTGKLQDTVTATDLVLTCVKLLREKKVVGKFVEFYGPGCATLTLADRATIANMSPEYGATMGFFPVDAQTMVYLKQTGREDSKVELSEKYLRAQGLFRVYDGSQVDPTYTSVLELDLSTVEACLAGPKRPHDHVSLKNMPTDFRACMGAPQGFKGFNIPQERHAESVDIVLNGNHTLRHGSIVIAAITSCTNTSNPSVMLGAALLARNAVGKGLNVPQYIKTSLSPGSGVVDAYLKKSGLLTYLEQLGFYTAGFGCQTCIGNSGELDEVVNNAIVDNDLVAAAVLSGNRNFEGRVHPLTRANYLASPPLVVAYALAGRIDIDFEKEPIAKGANGDVFLRDIWPSRDEVDNVERSCVLPEMFRECYEKVAQGPDNWNQLDAPSGNLFTWKDESTYIHNPPFFAATKAEPTAIKNVENAYCLLNFGDSITTDHISPAGKIAKNSPAGAYLQNRGIEAIDFNSYGSRRGNDEVMARGTFANIRIINKLVEKVGPKTLHIPTGETLDIYDAAMRYKSENHQTIILAGQEYGSGSSRDWAAKGPNLLGVQAVIAQSYERIHRSNLVGMGIFPLQFANGETAETLGLTGHERFSIDIIGALVAPGSAVTVTTDSGLKFTAQSRLDTEVEVEYFRHGGILNFVLRRLAKAA